MRRCCVVVVVGVDAVLVLVLVTTTTTTTSRGGHGRCGSRGALGRLAGTTVGGDHGWRGYSFLPGCVVFVKGHEIREHEAEFIIRGVGGLVMLMLLSWCCCCLLLSCCCL